MGRRSRNVRTKKNKKKSWDQNHRNVVRQSAHTDCDCEVFYDAGCSSRLLASLHWLNRITYKCNHCKTMQPRFFHSWLVGRVVLRPRQHNIGHTGDDYYRSKRPSQTASKYWRKKLQRKKRFFHSIRLQANWREIGTAAVAVVTIVTTAVKHNQYTYLRDNHFEWYLHQRNHATILFHVCKKTTAA